MLGVDRVKVQLWDCSGSAQYQSYWPCLAKVRCLREHREGKCCTTLWHSAAGNPLQLLVVMGHSAVPVYRAALICACASAAVADDDAC